jgi:hypothetical protein
MQMAQGIVVGFLVFGAVVGAFLYINDTKVTAAQSSRILDIINRGMASINFILAAPPIVLSEHEKVIAVLPKTILLEPKAVRVRQGSRHGSSMQFVRGYSVGSGSYKSTSESRDQLRTIDDGTLVVTNQRVAFLGALKTVTMDLSEIIGVDECGDGIRLHRKNKENVESFRISDDLKLTFKDGDEDVSVPFTGQILELVINKAMAISNERKARVAA